MDCFPATLSKAEEKILWSHFLKLENQDKIKGIPIKSDKVGLIRFLNGLLALANPLSTIHRSYEIKIMKTWRPLFSHPIQSKRPKLQKPKKDSCGVNYV